LINQYYDDDVLHILNDCIISNDRVITNVIETILTIIFIIII